jgi:S-adenosylmethionine synthetase
VDVSGIKEIYVWLLSKIGKPINEPSVVSAQIIPENGVSLKSVSKLINEVITDEFDHLQEFCRDLAEGKITLC